LTQEEIDRKNARIAAEDARRAEQGLPPRERPVVLDENGNIVIDQFGNSVDI
jgi:hypothetical protein